jgi:hypothetical protein
MKANELMIGDWVLDTRTGTPLRVNPFMAELEVPEWQPIPLTVEILEKNGFENIDNKYPFPTFRCDDKENYLCITICFPEGDKTKRKRPFIEIDGVNIYIGHLIINFVHELQHALKLCGIDKKIML